MIITTQEVQNPQPTEPMSEVVGRVDFTWNAGHRTNGIHGYLNGGKTLKKSVGVIVRLERPHQDGRPELHEMKVYDKDPRHMKIALAPISYIGYKEARCIIEIPLNAVGDLIVLLQTAQADFLAKDVEWNLERAIEINNKNYPTCVDGTIIPSM
jgi:hypothetical protein